MWFQLIIWFFVAIGLLFALSGSSGLIGLFYLAWKFHQEERARTEELYTGLEQSLFQHIDLVFQEHQQEGGDNNNEQGQGAIV